MYEEIVLINDATLTRLTVHDAYCSCTKNSPLTHEHARTHARARTHTHTHQMVSVERVVEYGNLPSEPPLETQPPHEPPPPNWPDRGAIELRDVSLRYAASLPVILRDLSINIHPSEKVCTMVCMAANLLV